MKQTAVEWLAEQVNTAKWKFADKTDREDIINQAKEIEKEQIMEAHTEGFYSEPFKSLKGQAEQYYNKIFKSE